MYRYHKILVPLDGSELGERALPPAVHLAEAMGASLILLRAVPGLPVILDRSFNEKLVHSRHSEAHTYLESVRADIQPTPVDIQLEIIAGAAAKTVIQYARQNEVDLIVLCSHGHSAGMSAWVFGSVSSRVLRKAPCSTLVIRAKKIVPLFSQKHILVPLDGSPLAEQALPPALAVAAAVSARITILSVVFSLEGMAPALYQHHLDKIMKEEQIDKELYLNRIRMAERGHKILMKTAIDKGPAGERIITHAQQHNVDLIVMCSHGRSGMEHWAYGSVTEKVLHGAPCAVLVVREGNDG